MTESTAVSSTAFTTCVAAPKPARWKTTVIGEAATLESAGRGVSIARARDGDTGTDTVGGGEERGILRVDAQADRQHREDVEDDDAEERRADGTRDSFVRVCALSRGEGDKLDTAIRVERVHERLGEGAEAADECLTVLEVRETLELRVSESTEAGA